MKAETLAFIAIFMSMPCLASDSLLPTSEAKMTEVKFSQDGRILNLLIRNVGNMTITSGTLVCTERSTTIGNCGSGLDDIFRRVMRETTERREKRPPTTEKEGSCHIKPGREEQFNFEEKIPPGRVSTIYREVIANVEISQCVAHELRGKEKSILDYLGK